MVFNAFCLRIYFWPFLSYLASLKGLCPYYPPGYFPNTTLPPNLSSTTDIPTFQPTPPTTLPPCPADPLVCLAGGERPIAYCPCIDPRQQNGLTTTADITTTTDLTEDFSQNLHLRFAKSYDTPVQGSDMMIFSHLDDTKKRKKRRKRKSLQDINRV